MFCTLFPSGVFICRGKEDALVTKNMAVGESVYGEKRMSVEVNPLLANLLFKMLLYLSIFKQFPK